MTGLRSALCDLPDATFLDVLERDDAYRFVVDLPGATPDDVSAVARAGRLVVEANTDASGPAGARFVERRRDEQVDVTLPLPPDAVAERASATVDRGVLTATVPKRDADRGTEIEVEGA